MVALLTELVDSPAPKFNLTNHFPRWIGSQFSFISLKDPTLADLVAILLQFHSKNAVEAFYIFWKITRRPVEGCTTNTVERT